MTLDCEMAPGLDVLIVEDNPADAELASEAFREVAPHHRLHVACDGEEAVSFLCRHGAYGDAPRPRLILLDLNLPRRNGREVLVFLKNDDRFRDIPVVVFTTSDAEDDVRYCYQHYANGYVRKPMHFDQLLEIIQSIDQFWCRVLQAPLAVVIQ